MKEEKHPKVKVQVSPRDRGRLVYSVNIPSRIAKALFLDKGQELRATGIMRRTGAFRIVFEGEIKGEFEW